MRRLALPLLVAMLFCAVLTLRAGTAGGPPPSPRSRPSATDTQDQNAFVEKYCVECHDDFTKAGELTLEQFDIARIGQRAELGEKMVRKLRTGLMPKKEAEQPPLAARQAMIAALESRLDA